MGILRKVLRHLAPYGLVLLFLGCASLDEDPSGTFTLDIEGRVAVLVVDNSSGPEEFDPDGLIREGAKFLLSSFSGADNVGIVTVRFPVKALLEITHLRKEGVRKRAWEALDEMKIGGDAEYFEALKKAKELLEIFSAQRDSAIVFLTGGLKRPSGNPQEIRELMKVFADRGWRFFPVVLTPAPDLLGVLEYGAALTQGAVFKIERPHDILSSLVTVSGKINDLWVRRRLAPAPVFEGAGRLLVAVTRGDKEAELDFITRDDQPVPFEAGGTTTVDRSAAFSTVTLPDPPAGTWAGKVKGEASAEAMLVKPPFEVYLDDEISVKGSALEGDEIHFDLVVDGDLEAIKTWAPKGYADVTIVSESTGKAVDHFPMDKTYISKKLRFSGRTRLFTTEPGTPEIFTARLTLVFGEGDSSWAREEFLSFELKPAEARVFRVEPAEVDFGVRWWDEKEISRNVEIVARVKEPVSVEAADIPEGLTVEPTTLSSALGRPGLMVVGLGDVLRREGGEGTLAFRIRGGGDTEEGPSFERAVKLRYRLVKFIGPSSVELESVQPGEEKSISMASWSVGEGRIPFGVECGPLEGPGLIVPVLDEEGDRRRLRIAVPENANPGVYEGRIVITPGEKTLGHRYVPISVTVSLPGSEGLVEGGEPALAVDPRQIDLTGDKTGWVRTSFRVAVPQDSPSIVLAGVQPSSLRGKNTYETISARFDIRVSPAPGWDGKNLVAGGAAAYVLDVYVSSDLPDDVYEGEAAVQFRVAGNEEILSVPVNLRLSLKRSQ